MKPPKASKEQQVLLGLLKGDLPASLEGINPKALFDLFRRHRLFPLADPILPLLEAEEQDKWKQAIRIRALRSMQQLAVCGRFTEAFTKAGLEAIPFKGPVLAHTLFGNLGQRHSSDLDILVRNKDIRQIIEMAGKIGYELKYPKKDLSERQWDYYLRYKKDIGLQSTENNIFIELHHGFENYLGLDTSHMDQFLQDTEQVSIGEFSFRTMNRPHTFLYLVMHGGVHQYRRLFWLRDVAEAIKCWDLDHQKLLSDAKEMGIVRLLGISLILAQEIFEVDIPDEYNSYLKKDRALLEKLKRTALKFILGPEFPDRKGKLQHHQFMLRLKPEFSHYFRTFREILNRKYIGKFLGGH